MYVFVMSSGGGGMLVVYCMLLMKLNFSINSKLPVVELVKHHNVLQCVNYMIME